MKKSTTTFLKRCRLCGRCHQGSIDIFSRKDRNLKELIKQCLNINVREDDPLPKKLCQFCEKKLSLWEKFKKSCDSVQVKLIADSLPSEFHIPREKEGDRICDEGDNNSHFIVKDTSCRNSVDTSKGSNKRSIKTRTLLSVNISSAPENSSSTKGVDAENLSYEPANTIKKSCSKQDLSHESILSEQGLKQKISEVSSVALSIETEESEGKINIGEDDLKTSATFNKSSQLSDQDIRDLNDTLSKNIIYERNPDANLSRSVQESHNITREEFKDISCVKKCKGSISSLRKIKISRKSNKTDETDTVTKSSPMKELQCPICPRKLSTTYNLNHHMETHSEHCNYCCHLCGKLFRTRSSLSNHVRVHLFDDAENVERDKGYSGTSSSVRLFQCEICEKKFRQSGHLSYHLKMHTGIRSHSCSICGKLFAEKYQLRRHENAVHSKLKRYTCDVCGKQFLHTHNFKDHKLQHEGIAKNSCILCGKAFLTSNALRRHQRLHTGVKPFVCDICGKKFRDCSNRKRHRDKHTKEEKLSKEHARKGNVESVANEEEITEVIEKDGDSPGKVKKTYMNLKTYFESNDDVSMKEDGKDGLVSDSIIESGSSDLLQPMSNDSNPGPLMDCGLFGEEIDINSDGLLLIGDGRIGSSMIGGSEPHNLKDQLVWVPSAEHLPNRDECFNTICVDDDDLQGGDVVLGGGDVGVQMGLCGMQTGDIAGIMEVGMGMCCDFDVGNGMDLDSGKDGLSNNFPSISDVKEVEGEKVFDSVLHLQVF